MRFTSVPRFFWGDCTPLAKSGQNVGWFHHMRRAQGPTSAKQAIQRLENSMEISVGIEILPTYIIADASEPVKPLERVFIVEI